MDRYSGMAYARPGNLMPIVVRDWPLESSGSFGREARVPTALNISNSTVHWDTPAFLDALDMAGRFGKTGKDLACIYLHHLWQHFLNFAQLGAYEKQQMRIVVTLPAGWPDAICVKVKDVLDQAGILGSVPSYDLQFLREPQAVALAMVYDAKDDSLLAVRLGNGIDLDAMLTSS